MYCIGHIQNSGIFRIKVHSSIFKQIKHLLEYTYTKYIHTYWGIIKAYSDMFTTLNNSLILATDTATRGVLWKKLFLEISQNSQENTCARVSFLIQLQVMINNTNVVFYFTFVLRPLQRNFKRHMFLTIMTLILMLDWIYLNNTRSLKTKLK